MKRSELSWSLQDYRDNNEEPPKRLLDVPGDTEGMLMSQDELEEYFIDSLKTIRILNEQGDGYADKLIENYLIDMQYLFLIGRITEDAYNELSNSNNFYF